MVYNPNRFLRAAGAVGMWVAWGGLPNPTWSFGELREIEGGTLPLKKLVKQLKANHQEGRWEEFSTGGLELLGRATPDLMVSKVPGHWMGAAEWMREMFQVVPPEIQREYRLQVSALVAAKVEAAVAEGNLVQAEWWATRYPVSEEEKRWKKLESLQARDTGEEWEFPSFTAAPHLTLTWSVPSRSGVAVSLAAQRLEGVFERRRVMVKRLEVLEVLDRRTGAPLESGEVGEISPLQFSLAYPTNTWFPLAPGEGIVVTRGSLREPDRRPLALLDWISRVKLGPVLEIVWEGPVLARPDRMMETSQEIEDVMSVEALMELRQALEKEKKAYLERLKDPKNRDAADELAAFEMLTNVIGLPLPADPPLMRGNGRILAALYPQGVIHVLSPGTGRVKWYRRVPEWLPAQFPSAAMGPTRLCVALGGETPEIHAYEAASGKTMWKRKGKAPRVTVLGVVRDVVIVADGLQIMGLDEATGREKWTWEASADVEGVCTVASGVAWCPVGARLVGLDALTGVKLAEVKRQDEMPGLMVVNNGDLCDITPRRCSLYRLIPSLRARDP